MRQIEKCATLQLFLSLSPFLFLSIFRLSLSLSFSHSYIQYSNTDVTKSANGLSDFMLEHSPEALGPKEFRCITNIWPLLTGDIQWDTVKTSHNCTLSFQSVIDRCSQQTENCVKLLHQPDQAEGTTHKGGMKYPLNGECHRCNIV